jgi:hypothetical protein
VALWIDGDDRLAVFEEHGRRVAQVLPGFAVDDDLTLSFSGQVDERDGVAARNISGPRRFLGTGGRGEHYDGQQ